MKKMVIILISLVLFTGCSKNINAEGFQSKLEKKDFEVHNVLEQYDTTLVSNAIVAINKTGNYQIEFLEFKSVDAAKNSFQINRDDFKSNATEKSKETSSSKEKISKYTLTTEDTFYLISRIDNTMIYLTVDGSYKSDCLKVLKDLGY